MNLRDWFGAVWFKGFARIAAIILLPSVGGVAGFMWAINGDVDAVEAAQITLAKNVGGLTDDMAEVKDGVEDVQADLAEVSKDVATMTGVLQEMQRTRALAYVLP